MIGHIMEVVDILCCEVCTLMKSVCNSVKPSFLSKWWVFIKSLFSFTMKLLSCTFSDLLIHFGRDIFSCFFCGAQPNTQKQDMFLLLFPTGTSYMIKKILYLAKASGDYTTTYTKVVIFQRLLERVMLWERCGRITTLAKLTIVHFVITN